MSMPGRDARLGYGSHCPLKPLSRILRFMVLLRKRVLSYVRGEQVWNPGLSEPLDLVKYHRSLNAPRPKGKHSTKAKGHSGVYVNNEHSIDDITYSQIYEAKIAASVKTVAWQACSYPPEKRGSGRRSVASEDEYLHILPMESASDSHWRKELAGMMPAH